MQTALIYLLIISSLLSVHEAGHYLCFLKKKIAINQIHVGMGPRLFSLGRWQFRLLPLGAAVVPDPLQAKDLSNLDWVAIAWAGPLANFLCGLVMTGVAFIEPAYSGLLYFGYLHITTAMFNLLPVPPLDGFVIARHYWRWVTSKV